MAWEICDMEIGNCHDVEVFSLELGNHAGKIREGCCVDGEGAILDLIVDVEINNIGRNSVSAETIGDLPDLRFRTVAVA